MGHTFSKGLEWRCIQENLLLQSFEVFNSTSRQNEGYEKDRYLLTAGAYAVDLNGFTVHLFNDS